MKRKIFLFNVIILMCIANLTVSAEQSPADRLPDGAIARFSPGASVYTVAFSPNGQLLASGGNDNAIILWNTTSNLELKTLIGHKDWVKSVAFSPNGQMLASVAMDGSFKLWEVSTGINFTSRKQDDRMESVAFSLHGDMLATSGHIDGFIDLWTVSKKQVRHANRIGGHLSAVSSIAFSPDGKMLASGGDDDTLRLWNVDERSEIKSITEHSNDVRSVVFSPDGKTLASGSKDGTVKLLEVPSGDVIATLEHDYVESVAFSPDGEVLASAGAGYTIKLWSASSHAELASLKGHGSGVTSVVFSPDGKTLSSGSRDGTVLIWDLSYFNIKSNPIIPLRENEDTLVVKESDNSTVEFLPEAAEPNVTENENLLPRQDTTPPAISLDVPTTGFIQANADQFTVQGSVTDDNGVDEVRINNLKATVLKDGTFTTVVQLSEGENLIRVTTTDTSGNTSTNQFIIRKSEKPSPSLIFDATPPTIIILSPAERVRHLTIGQLIVQCSVTDNNGIDEVEINGRKAAVIEDGTFTTVVQLSEGENLIRVTATDTSGNMGTNQFTIIGEKPSPLPDTIGPDIRILYPDTNVTRGVKAKIRLTESFTDVSGTVTDPSGIAEVKINGVETRIIGDDFRTTVQLDYGDNQIKVAATDTWGNESEEGIIIFREGYVRKGTDYALLFAVESYDYWPDLMSPLYDAEAIREDLQNIYDFQVELIHNPTRERILETLLRYGTKQYTDEDQMLIFFAGHGHFNPGFREGYLVARDTRKPEDDITMGSYLSHSEFRNIINRMSCKHIFLLLDTCYSGTFDQRIAMRGEAEDVSRPLSYADIEEKLKYKTRWYLTSGGKEQVPDGGRGHSPFAHELLEALRSRGGIDGILTIDEVLRYLRKLDNPKPRASGFGNNKPGSDFLFIEKRQ